MRKCVFQVGTPAKCTCFYYHPSWYLRNVQLVKDYLFRDSVWLVHHHHHQWLSPTGRSNEDIDGSTTTTTTTTSSTISYFATLSRRAPSSLLAWFEGWVHPSIPPPRKVDHDYHVFAGLTPFTVGQMHLLTSHGQLEQSTRGLSIRWRISPLALLIE